MRGNYLFGFLCIATLFLGSITFSSCSKDNDNDEGYEEPDLTINVLDKIKDPILKKYIEIGMKNKAIKAAELDFLSVVEAASVTELGISMSEGGDKIKSMEGIEYFTGLERLYMNYTASTTVDLSKNTKLKELNVLSSIGETLTIISPSVERMEATYSKSKTITIDAPKLTWLKCDDSRVIELNTTKCPNLKMLRCGGSKIKALDLSQNLELEELVCGGSGNITSRALDISKNKKLHTVYASMGNAPLLYLYVWWDGGIENTPKSFKKLHIDQTKTKVLKKED